MAVALETEPAFRPETPRTLFQGTYVSSRGISGTQWNVSSDGKRFLMMKESQAIEPASASGGLRKINIIVNWSEELKQRALVK